MLPRILVVDDHAVIGDAIRMYLGAQYDVTPVTTIEAARERLTQQQFDVAILDLDFKSATPGTDLVADLHAKNCKVAIYSGTCDIPTFRLCLNLNVAAFMDKQEPAKCIPEMIHIILAGEKYFPQHLLLAAIANEKDRIPSLPRVAAAVLGLLVTTPSITNQGIADQVRRSVGHIRNTMTLLLTKFEVENRIDLVNEAKRRGFAPMR